MFTTKFKMFQKLKIDLFLYHELCIDTVADLKIYSNYLSCKDK